MAAKNPVELLLNEFAKKWGKLSIPIVNGISEQLSKGKSVTAAVDFIFKKHNVKKEFRSLVLKTVLESAEASGVTIKSPLAAQDYFLGKHWPGDPLTLSQKINRLEFKQLIKNEISRNMKEGSGITRIAKSLTDKDLTKADIPKYINDLTGAARRVAAGDADAIKEYRAAISKAGKQVEKLAEREVAGSVRLKKAYQNIIDTTENFTDAQLDKAIERAVKAKARYNAERIARTEGARAYGSGKITEAQADEDVVALRWELSSAHDITDICDFNHNADLYGIGEGVYPKDKFPTYPAHPHCLCIIEEVFGEEKLEGEYNPEGGEEYLKNLDKKDRVKLLGTEGTLKNWEKDLKGFGDEQLPELPERIVKSK